MVSSVGSKILIAPSMLACDLSKIGDEIKALEKAGADVLHFDIMDGHFVPNITFGFPLISAVRGLTKLPFDAHLMITNADAYLDEFAKVGCNWLSVHVEACPHLNRTVARIRELGMKAGVAINPGTAISSLDAILHQIDFVLVMSVNPGFGGQKFIPGALDRVRDLRAKRSDLMIQIDGGIKQDNVAQVVEAGANCLVMGTGLLGQKDYGAAIRSFKSSAERNA